MQTAANGAEALDIMHSGRPDAIVLDLMMPVMDGWVFAERCHGEGVCDGTPVVVMSAARDLPSVAQRLRSKGVRAVLAKPFELEALLATVEQYARSRPA